MKRIAAVMLAVLLLTGCAAARTTGSAAVIAQVAHAPAAEPTSEPTPPVYDTPEALIGSYLKAVQEREYEVIWNMIPVQIQNYAIANGIIRDKQDGLDFIRFALNDYSVIAEMDLPSRQNIQFWSAVVDIAEDVAVLRAFFKENRVYIVPQELLVMKIAIEADGIQSVFYMEGLIRIDDGWYLVSVVGEDELFGY